MFEATEFNGWFYGTEYNSLVADKINIGTFNPAGVSALLEAPNITTMVIYVDAPDKTRLLRYLQRSENPNCAEMCRRYFADEKDFDNLEFEYYVFSNPDGNCPDLLENHGIMIPISRMWINLGKDQESFNNTMKLIKAK